MKFDPPLLTEGPLTGKIYVVTHGKIIGDKGIVQSSVKYDVSEQFHALALNHMVGMAPQRALPAVDDLLNDDDALDRMKAEQNRFVYPEPDNEDGRAWARRILGAALGENV